MAEQFTHDESKLEKAREYSLTFLKKRKRWSVVLFWLAGVFEIGFLILMLVFMDFKNSQNLFFFFAVFFIYCPLIMMVWRNSFKIDDLYYRLIHELKYQKDFINLIDKKT